MTQFSKADRSHVPNLGIDIWSQNAFQSWNHFRELLSRLSQASDRLQSDARIGILKSCKEDLSHFSRFGVECTQAHRCSVTDARVSILQGIEQGRYSLWRDLSHSA